MRRLIPAGGPPRVVLAVAVVVLLLGALLGWFLIVGDGGADGEGDVAGPSTTSGPASPPTTPTTVPETTTTTLSREDRVVRAYEEAWTTVYELSTDPAPEEDAARLRRHFTGTELDRRVGFLEILQGSGSVLVFDEESVFSADVMSVSFDEVDGVRIAHLDACVVEEFDRVVQETGNLVQSASGVRTGEVAAELRRVDGRWKVADNQTDNREEGRVGCALD